MTGNDFLKYPPHKNVIGAMPIGAYHRLRFQMEAAKVPYIKQRLKDGTLEVQKIYNTQYKVVWTPVGGFEIYYVVRYTLNDEERVKFLDANLVEVKDVLASVFLSSEWFMNLQGWEWRTGDLICAVQSVQFNDYWFSTLRIKFYNPAIGDLVDYSWVESTVSQDGYNNPLQKELMTITGNAAYDAVYTALYGDNSVLRLKPVKDSETGVYTIEESPVNVGADVFAENMTWWYRSVPGLVIFNPDTGAVLETKITINIPGVHRMIWYTPVSYWESFGDIADNDPPYSEHTYIPGRGYAENYRFDVHPSLPGRIFYKSYLPGSAYYDISDVVFYDSEGQSVFTDVDQSILEGLWSASPYVNIYSRNIRTFLYWKGLSYDLDYIYLYENPTGDFDDRVIYSRRILVDSVELTEDELKVMFGLDITADIAMINYLPGLEKNSAIQAIL